MTEPVHFLVASDFDIELIVTDDAGADATGLRGLDERVRAARGTFGVSRGQQAVKIEDALVRGRPAHPGPAGGAPRKSA